MNERPVDRHSRIDDIEALRAVAILITILGHIRFMLKWNNAHLIALDTYVSLWSGVDLFFAISGFVIARDILKRYDRVAGPEGFWRETIAFWVRRAYRIWPTAWLWAALLVVCGLVFGAKYWPDLRTGLIDLAAVMAHVVNIHQWMCANRMADAACGSTVVWWSLSLEEQFYIALPLALLLIPRRVLPTVLGVLIAIQFFIPRPVWSLFWVLRTDALMLGVLIAMFERTKIYPILKPTFLLKRRASIPVMLALMFLLVEIPSNLAGKIEVVPFSTGLVALVAAATVLIASYNQNVIAREGVLKQILMWIGSRSYGIYLIHSFCIGLTAQIWTWLSPAGTVFGPNFTLRFLVTFLGLTFGLAELNFRLLETPLRKRGSQVATKIASGKTNVVDLPASAAACAVRG
ncbi:O-acetyltransferase OatA [Paraburkholderia nemoris]|uniref:acyltransferase family protein n=1 Tax=Paraburkholderia nemoris TaxID=2793076 RepID=UPI001B251258|nr:acyltransferase [Paraburkholderia nemoris]CAE6971618.1 O-acetyltransferase OatA [Paraburkholderia nemoris]